MLYFILYVTILYFLCYYVFLLANYLIAIEIVTKTLMAIKMELLDGN